MMRIDEVVDELRNNCERLDELKRHQGNTIRSKQELSVAQCHLERCLDGQADEAFLEQKLRQITKRKETLGIHLRLAAQIGFVHLCLSGLVARGEMPAEWHREVSVAMVHLREALLRIFQKHRAAYAVRAATRKTAQSA
jgi:hypothetical protein